jgi:hypothetical protein
MSIILITDSFIIMPDKHKVQYFIKTYFHVHFSDLIFFLSTFDFDFRGAKLSQQI